MYEAWLKNPSSVDMSWQAYFKNMEGIKPMLNVPLTGPVTSVSTSTQFSSDYDISDHMKVQLLVRAYQVRGHHIAKLDPLDIKNLSSIPKELDPQYYGFSKKDLDRQFYLGPGILPGFAETKEKMTLHEIVECGTIGIEYTHILDRVQCDWIRDRIEIPKPYDYSGEEKRMILDRLIWSDSFERFVSTKYPTEKRFGLEGCESLIPGMKALIDRSVDLGIESIVLGMAHRGRLNVLSNVVRKPNESIFCEFGGSVEPSDEGSGDVKYHLGMNYVRPTPSGKRVHLSLAANPSHLEAVNPVVLGKIRALQYYMNDEKDRHHSMALLLHGDASFAAQGVVYETIGFHDLPNYTTGGTIHIIINNQIGFTTDPRFARSTSYCSDIAKVVNAPIFHVNGDDAEAVNFVCQLAAEWRQTFKKDFVVDIVCYRKYGHNEVDQPSFTQPRMYKQIAKQTPILDKYVQRLTAERTFSMEDIQKHKKWVWGMLEESYTKSKDYIPTRFKSPKEIAEEITPIYPTGSTLESLKHIGQVISSYPNNFHVHSGLVRMLKARAKSIEDGENIDWSTAESLAFGSLLLEGKHVRLSGQDVERGTFSQRHAVLHDQENESQYVPLNDLRPGQARYVVCNSSLSEFGTLGFELGYSLVDPNSLILWEAQFGDFVNNAQCIIDQFISSGEKKWLQRTGLVVLLPHGYDGQGPEHSSGRIERFLQLCDDHPYIYPPPDKMSRQHQDCNMQLIVFTSKSLLRHPMARSTLNEMVGDTYFARYIPEPHPETLVAPEKITRHILCTGQVYYALLRAREQNNMNHIAISRIEQLSPFPYDLLSQHVDKYPNAKLVWVQEEPLNSGKAAEPVTRPPSASPATGNKAQHIQEEHELLSQALIGQIIKPTDVVSGVPVWK
ncbi:5523_t:CDS:2 [Racocetra fulgida]|uniref:2-oxoglutarate dehydrogenase, mitochondrial n=1 Tax=Racocetra fulgida TaxID=60492 RepID=A0A9N8VZR2_9GLOM|nr:5523_t:CDS:2 [Racocetra fulgida]